MNNKGFTLIELIATIVVLALVTSIATYSIANVIKNTKQKNYELLVEYIKDASELYYQECRYVNNTGINCNSIDGGYQITLGELVTYGYLKGNDRNSNTLINPLNGDNVGDCQVNIVYEDGSLIVSSNSSSESCPDNYGNREIGWSVGDFDADRLNPGIGVPTVRPGLKIK